MAEERKRELVLPPGEFAMILDGTKGQVRLHVGPIVINQTNQDKPVRYNHKTYRFEECALDDSRQLSVVVPEGFYAVLINPAKGAAGKVQYPEPSRINDTPELQIGEKLNIPGPVNFALYPGQTAEVRRGHHLRSNEFLRIKVYNEEKAKENWTKAIVKAADSGADPKTVTATRQAPPDITVGKQYNILGTEVSFYIPPTGVSVVPDEQEVFVRDAETLEQLEYAILVDEDGNKAYPKGPSVVFPRPTQRFLTAQAKVDGDVVTMRKFKAIEMNELQGIQLKFMKDVSLTFADGTVHKYAAGEEAFITGKEMPIYYPEEGHQLVKYDGKTLHYAVAIPKGEARYVMNRKTGEIRTEMGPKMLLPNPVTEIIVRRALSDGESMTWFPGNDGKGSRESLAYNQMLRAESAKEPTTRQGVVSEGRIEQQGGPSSGGAVSMDFMANAAPSGFDAIEAAALNYAGSGAMRMKSAAVRSQAKQTMMPESRQGKNQDAMLGDVAERKSTFNDPRTITFANKYKGVPTIKVQPGYAVQVADFDGKRSVVEGPKTALLSFDQTLDNLSLSTGKPKNTDALLKTAYLNIYNNKITDIVSVETIDHVVVGATLAYNVTFEGDQSKWFAIENYVKHLCDHVRSVLKGKVRKLRIEEFYAGSTDIIRDIILGASTQKDPALPAARTGMLFPENGMRVTDVEVLSVKIGDERIGHLLAQAQHEVVAQNISLSQHRKHLEVTTQTEEIGRALEATRALTAKSKLGLEAEMLALALKNDLAKLQAEQNRQAEQLKISEAIEEVKNVAFKQNLFRTKIESDQEEEMELAAQKRQIEMIDAQAKAIIAQMQSVNPALVAALEAAGARETLVEVSRALSFHQMFGAENGLEFVQKVFANTPVKLLIEKAMKAAAVQPNGDQGRAHTS